jgi:hypothetical protein
MILAGPPLRGYIQKLMHWAAVRHRAIVAAGRACGHAVQPESTEEPWPMLDPENFPSCSEFYIVEKVVEVVTHIGGEPRQVRIEALKDKSGKYSTRGYILDHVKLQAAFSDGETKSTTIWLPYDLPWTHRTTADDALTQALGFLPKNSA